MTKVKQDENVITKVSPTGRSEKHLAIDPHISQWVTWKGGLHFICELEDGSKIKMTLSNEDTLNLYHRISGSIALVSNGGNE